MKEPQQEQCEWEEQRKVHVTSFLMMQQLLLLLHKAQINMRFQSK